MGNVRFQLHHILNWFVDLVATRKYEQVTEIQKVALRFNLRATLRGTTLIHQCIEPWPSSHTVRGRYASTIMGAPMTRY